MSKRDANEADITAQTSDEALANIQAFKQPKFKFTTALVFNGNCNEAIDYYTEVFGSKTIERWPYSSDPTMTEESENWEWKDKIIHAVIEFNAATIYLSDRSMDADWTAGNNVRVSVAFESLVDADKIFKALASDGEVLRAFKKQFWVCFVYF